MRARALNFILILFFFLGFIGLQAKAPSKELKPIKDTKESIDQKNKPSVVMFYAPWCGYCKMMFPVMQELQGKYKQANFFYINIDDPDGRKLAQTYKGGLNGVPEVHFYNQKGLLISSALGARSKEVLEANMKSIL